MANITCIGAGNVGRAWAVIFAKAGHDVTIYDISTEAAQKTALARIQETLSLLHKNRLLDEPVSEVLGRIQFVPTIKQAVSAADYMQESIVENADIKRELFAEISDYAKPECILASSTSAIKGSEFLTSIIAPERALVAHPVNPPSLIPLVELCGSGSTSEATILRTQAILEDAGMKPIRLNKEIDGFILNRLQFTLVAEAMHLVGEGYCSASDIDRVMTDGLALRWASIGPFEVAHLNADGGFSSFVEHLGTMMKNIGKSARTDYDWGNELVQTIHAEMEKKVANTDIQDRQNWRDERILAARKMQEQGHGS